LRRRRVAGRCRFLRYDQCLTQDASAHPRRRRLRQP
jgi:hypothetical protein